MPNKIYIGNIYEQVVEENDVQHYEGALEDLELLIAVYIKRNIDPTLPKAFLEWMDKDTTNPFQHNGTEYVWGFPKD